MRTPTTAAKPPEAPPLIRSLEERVNRIFRRMERKPFFVRFLSGALAREEYAYFLVQTYHYVMITPDTYRWAQAAMRRSPRPHYPAFAQEFEEHWQEELGHEHWLLEDLAALGYDPQDLVRKVGPNPAIQAYVALSRFAMAGEAPLALLGQDYFLESLAQAYGGRIVASLARSPIPNVMQAVKFLAGHGEADIRHMEMNRKSVARVEDPDERDAILTMAETTGWLYSSIPDYYSPEVFRG